MMMSPNIGPGILPGVTGRRGRSEDVWSVVLVAPFGIDLADHLVITENERDLRRLLREGLAFLGCHIGFGRAEHANGQGLQRRLVCPTVCLDGDLYVQLAHRLIAERA